MATATRLSERTGPKKSSAKTIAIVAGVVVAALALYWIFGRGGKQAADPRGGGRAVPIVAAKATLGDLPVVISAVGTVTPTEIVTVKTRVSGHIQSILFKEGQMVKEGDLLVEIDPRPYQVQLMQAEGNRAKNRAALHNAKLDLERYKSLFEKGVTSSQQLDTHTAAVEQLEAALMSDEGSVESSKLNLTYCKITAPISGRVGLRNVDPGNLVSTNDPNGIVVITPLSPIHVVFAIAGDAISKVYSPHESQRLNVEAWDKDLTKKLATGKVFALDNQVDLATGTLKIKALYENSDHSLFPNQFVNVRLFVDTLRNAILVPSASIQRGIQGDYVYVVKEDSTVELRVVGILAAQGDVTALSKGLQAGETVVTDGIERLRPGAKVIIPGAEPPQGGRGAGEGQRLQGPGAKGPSGGAAPGGGNQGQRQGRTGS